MPRLLLVEDSTNVTDALRVLFEATGHEVDVAASVAEAVASIAATRFDLVLLDLTLPDGDGLLVLERVRGAGHAVPPVAAMTGHDDAATVARCAAAGCLATLVKPVPARELVRRVDEWTR